ncbi:hypothetical protein [Oricola sp.]|uniref:hypothetical protein n=1 Tax=Oricola sp. TaxID=1979950 RepID=UPI002601092F|nr:hypothetical protein [Oricola sp.]MCI5075215.1 hypothetical protein [Oricola sp.]
MPEQSKPTHQAGRPADAGDHPVARTADLIVRRLPSETLIYDLKTHRATCLDARATAVWDECDGTKSPDQIRSMRSGIGASGNDIDGILRSLAESGLIEGVEPSVKPEPETIDRRRALASLGTALAATASSVMTLSVPTPAMAASGNVCAGDGDCEGVLNICINIDPITMLGVCALG